MPKQVSPKIIALSFGVLAVSFLAAFYVVAWQEPTQAPPAGNVSTPLNTSSTAQSKTGGLILNTGGAEYGLIIDKGISEFGGSVIYKPINRPISPVEGQIYFDQGDKKMYYYNGVEWIELAVTSPQECGVCTIWSFEAGECAPLPAGTKDENCNTLHYACDGAGSCTAPKSYGGWTGCLSVESGTSLDALCRTHGYEGLDKRMLNACYSCGDPNYIRTSDSTCHFCSGVDQWECYQCWKWQYD